MSKRKVELSDFEQRIREHMDRAYQRVFGNQPPGGSNFSAPYMEPPVDVYQTPDSVVVLMEIAGIPGEEIDLQVEGHTMVIHGHRRPLPGPPNRSYSQMEIAQGAFQREILLPAEVNAQEVSATYRDGILHIVMPKANPTLTRQLRIIVKHES